MEKQSKGLLTIILVCLVILLGGLGFLLCHKHGIADDSKKELSLAVPPYEGESYAEINGGNPFFSTKDCDAEAFEFYYELDWLGRSTGAEACLGTELMPTEERQSISEVKPTGWQTVTYNFVDQKSLYNRCHLIAYQLTGENANERNLITGTRYMNVDGMLPFEEEVASYIKETNNHVYYRVRPVYEGQNLVADGVVMEAYSIEDSGKGICFNVYCYNVQPGVVIDYKDGSNQLDPDFSVEEYEKEQQDSRKEEDNQETKTLEALYDANGTDYVLNTGRKKIHRPDCRSVQDMSPKNTYEIKAKLQELVEAGYVPRKNCRP